MHNVGNKVVLSDANLRTFNRCAHNLLRNFCGFADEANLGIRFDQPLPIYQCGRIDQGRARQLFGQNSMRLGGVIVILHLDTDARPLKPAGPEVHGQILHWMNFGGLNKMVTIADYVLMLHPAGATSPQHVHVTAPPNRFALHGEDHPLMHIKRPPVIAGKPGLI